jgi:uridine kinase
MVENIIKRDGRIVPFNKNKISDAIFRAALEVGGSNRSLAETLAEKVIGIVNDVYKQGSIPSVEEIQDIVEKVLVENRHYKTAKAFILYRAEHQRLREGKASPIIVEDNIPYKTLWNVFTWNVDHSCESIEKLNNHIKSGTFLKLIKDSEKLYHNEINKVVERILNSSKPIRMVIVAGPSSSGKTTTTTKIGEKLKNKGKEFTLLNLDNYFKNLNEHPKDEYGDYDYESPNALDLPLINEHLNDLLIGKTIKMPNYDFKTGKRTEAVHEFKLLKNQILLIDSLHGLYPAMTSSIPHEMKFRFYIESLCQIKDQNGEFVRWTDLRLLRRMVRDSWHRSYEPEMTVGHWHYVRRSEKKYIVPFINKVDYIFNGSLAYELPIYRKYLYKHFPAIIEKYQNDPKRADAYIRAMRVYELLKNMIEISDDSIVPKDSLIREFIGGSSYSY